MAVVTVPEQPSSSRSRVLLGVGVVGLLVAGIFAALAIAGSSTASAGADTPEDAYRQLFVALGDEDLIGAAEILLPGERTSIVEPWFDMVDELQRLEILDPNFDLSSVPGIDFEFENLEFEQTQVSEDLVSVRLLGGTSATTVEATALPLGRLVLDRLPKGALPEGEQRELASIDADDEGLIAVRRDGKWFVSFWYSVAEVARNQAGLPLPDPDEAIVARGESTPEAAVEEMIRSAIDLDVRRMIELLPPTEAEALHFYAPLFLEDAESAARSTRRAMRDLGIDIDLVSLDLSSTSRGDDQIVQFHGGEILVTSDYVDVGLEVSDGLFSARVLLHEEDVRFGLTVAGDCVELEVRDGSGELLEVTRECAGNVDRLINEFVGGEVLTGDLPEFDIFSSEPVLGIYTTKEAGQWFVSPVGTALDSQVDVLAAIDRAKLEDLLDWFIDQAEAQDLEALL